MKRKEKLIDDWRLDWGLGFLLDDAMLITWFIDFLISFQALSAVPRGERGIVDSSRLVR